jgi:hypothetical protein
MSSKKFTAVEREAIFEAYVGKCAYTSRLLEADHFHIDHIIPEFIFTNIPEFKRLKDSLKLSDDFNPHGWENLLPTAPSANLTKGRHPFDNNRAVFFLEIAAQHGQKIESLIQHKNRRLNAARSLLLLQTIVESGELSRSQLSGVLRSYDDLSGDTIKLTEALKLTDLAEIDSISILNLSELYRAPIRVHDGTSYRGVYFCDDNGKEFLITNCEEYREAIQAIQFKHILGMLDVVSNAQRARVSFVDDPPSGLYDIKWLPVSLFPFLEEPDGINKHSVSYQDRVNEESLIIKEVSRNHICVEEPEGLGQHLTEILRADLNDDGIEDILLFEYYYATHGTFGSGSIKVITRLSKNSMFEEVKFDECS